MKVTVGYFLTFEVPDELISDEIYDTQERIKDLANELFKENPLELEPIIHDCDNLNYIE